MAKKNDVGDSAGSPSTSTQTGSARPNPFQSGRKGPNIGLRDVDSQLFLEALDAALDAGVLVSLGRTSDGGAIGCYVTDGSDRFKSWAADSDALEELFTQLRDAYA